MANLIKSRRLYVLWHVAREDSDDEDAKMIGIYSSRRSAQRTIARLVKVVGFRRYPKGFHISLYRLDETSWTEGFTTYRWRPKPAKTKRADIPAWLGGRSAKTKRADRVIGSRGKTRRTRDRTRGGR